MPACRRLQIWSDLEAAGGSALAEIPDLLDLADTRNTRDDQQLTCTVPYLSAAYGFLSEKRVFRQIADDGTIDEWRISQIAESRIQNGGLVVPVTADWPSIDLGDRALINRTEADGSVSYDFDIVGLTPTQIIDQFCLPALTAVGITYVARGSVSPTQPISLTVSGDTVRSLLQKVCQTITPNPEFQLRRNGGSQWLIDIVTAIGSGAATLDIRSGKNATTLKRTRRTDQLATVVVPRGAVVDVLHASMALAQWKVTNVAGTVITLADPAGGDGPIAFDNQFSVMGCYFRTAGGTLTAITACSFAGQTVTVASATGITNGDLIQIRANSAGAQLTELWDPVRSAGLGSGGYGRIVRILDRPDLPATVNLLGNAACRTYSNPSSVPDGWAKVHSPTCTQSTTPARWKSGGSSCRMQTTNDGDGVETGYAPIGPTAASPYFSGFVTFWLDGASGAQVRVEMIVGLAAVSVSTIVFSTGIVTVTTGSAHGLTTGDTVEIVGASPDDYNGIFVVTVVDSTHFTYAIYTTPGAASGTVTSRKVWKIPQGTNAKAWSNQLAAWDDLGVAGNDLNALGGLFAKMRISQDGLTSCDCYVDSMQLTQSSGQQPFVETSGPLGLWQAANQYLRSYSQPLLTYESGFIDLKVFLPKDYPSDDVVLGGSVNIRDEELNLTASTRILEIARKYLQNGKPTLDTALTFSDRPDDITDLLLRKPLPKLPTRSAAAPSAPIVLADIADVPGIPGQVYIRLASSPQGAIIRYFVGDSGSVPPSVSVFGSGAPTQTAWGTYAGVFTVNVNATGDTQLFAYCQLGGALSNVQSWRIARDAPAAVMLTLQESPANTLKASWAPNTTTRWVRVYRRKNGIGWPTLVSVPSSITRSGTTATVTTSVPHNLMSGDVVVVSGCTQTQYNGAQTVTVTDSTHFTYTVAGSPATPATGSPAYTSPRDALDESNCFIEQVSTQADGAGYTATGTPVAGSTTWTDGTVYAATDTAYVILVPIDTRGNPSTRSWSFLVIAGAISPAIKSPTLSQLNNGSACNGTSGMQVQVGWTPNAGVVDGTHKLVINSEAGSQTVTTPQSTTSVTFRVPFMVTGGKFDPSVTLHFTYQLILVATSAVLDSGAIGNLTFKSSCAL